MEQRCAMLKDNIVINIVMFELGNALENYYTFVPLEEDSDVRITDAYNPQTGLFEHRDAIVPETTVVVFE
jgi:hypothetical protein